MRFGNTIGVIACGAAVFGSFWGASALADTYRFSAFINMEKMTQFNIPYGSSGKADWWLHVYDEDAHASLGSQGKKNSQTAKHFVFKVAEIATSTPRLSLMLKEWNRFADDDVYRLTDLRMDAGVAEQVLLVSDTEDRGRYAPQATIHTTVAYRLIGENHYHLSETSLERGLIRLDSKSDGGFIPFALTIEGYDAPFKSWRSAELKNVLYFFRIERL